MSATIAAIDMPAWATMAVAVGLIGALDRIVVGRRRVAQPAQADRRYDPAPSGRRSGPHLAAGRGKKEAKNERGGPSV